MRLIFACSEGSSLLPFLTLSLFSIVNILFHKMGRKTLILILAEVCALLPYMYSRFVHVFHPMYSTQLRGED